MIFKPEDEIFEQSKRHQHLWRAVLIILCIIVFILGFVLAGPIISLFR